MRFKVFALIIGCSILGHSADQKDMKVFYLRSCAACHGQDGSARGASGQKLPGRVLNDSRWQAHEKDADLVHSILKGKGGMPAYQSQLTDEEAQKLVAEIIRPMAAMPAKKK